MSFWLFFIAINIVAFFAFGWDKLCAIRQWSRTPERVLLGIAYSGGALGAMMGQQFFHHKTLKQPFRTLLWGAAVFNLLVLLGLVYGRLGA